MQLKPKIIIICGPTSSGKTNFAHNLALKYGGEIVNGDSRQLYKDLPILTASPPLSLRQELSYHLYNYLNSDANYSIANYAKQASLIIKDILSRGKLPIIVGGSGLYIKALTIGYSIMPKVSLEIKAQTKTLYEEAGLASVYAALTPHCRANLKAKDFQRILRAYEILIQTGKSIYNFQAQNEIKPLVDYNIYTIVLSPERHFLHEMINLRTEEMFTHGAIDEVRAKLDIIADLPKIIGLNEIVSYLTEKISLNEAISLTQIKTRQYAKRQVTWFKHQITQKQVLDFSSIAQYQDLLINLKL